MYYIYDSYRFILSFIYHNYLGKKTLTYCVSIYDKNKDQSGIGAKQVKNDFFFHQDWLFFCQKQLGKLFGTRMSVPLTSGCVRGADPDLRGFLPEVQECLSAMSETLLCPVFTSYPAEKGVFSNGPLWGDGCFCLMQT